MAIEQENPYQEGHAGSHQTYLWEAKMHDCDLFPEMITFA